LQQSEEQLSCRDSFGDLTWVQRKGKAEKIAVGANGSLWKLEGSAVGGRQIYQWSDANWKKIGTKGFTALAIDPNGVPWAVDNQRILYKRTEEKWEFIADQIVDIAIGADKTVFVLS